MKELSPLLDEKTIDQMFDPNKGRDSLFLSKQNLDDKSIPYLCNYLKRNPVIDTLFLDENAIGPEGATFFAKNNKTIKSLHLSRNKIGDVGCDALIKHHNYLNHLYVHKNNIGDRGVLNIHLNTTLEFLDIAYNSLTDLGAIYLSCNTSLKTLWMRANKINQLGAYHLEENQTLHQVDVCAQGVSEPARKSLLSLENRNQLIQVKYLKELTNLLYQFFIPHLAMIILEYRKEDIVPRYYESIPINMPESTQAAEPGDSEFKRAMRYSKGEGVVGDMKEACFWYQKAAEKGHVNAQLHLAAHYLEETDIEETDVEKTGVDKNFELAFKWFLEAAMQGHTNSLCNLAIHFATGKGVEKDDESAVFWYTIAAQRGHKGAHYNLAVHYNNGKRRNLKEEEKEIAEADKQYRKMFSQTSTSTNPHSFINRRNNNLGLNQELSSDVANISEDLTTAKAYLEEVAKTPTVTPLFSYPLNLNNHLGLNLKPKDKVTESLKKLTLGGFN